MIIAQASVNGGRWFSLNASLSRCIVAQFAPAERMETIQRRRMQPMVRTFGPPDAPRRIQVSDDRSTWFYFPTQQDCEDYLDQRRQASGTR